MSDDIKVLAGNAPVPFKTVVNGTPILATPEGWQTHSLDHCLDNPIRVDQAINIIDLDDLIEYIDRFGTDNTVIRMLCDEGGTMKVFAEIDYHQAAEVGGRAGWCSHQAIFHSVATPAWAAWTANSGRLMRQAKFADFIYRNLVDIAEPAGADLLELIQTLKATARGEFRDMKDVHTGSVELLYRMTVSTQGSQGDRAAELPKDLVLKIAPFYGIEPVAVKADLLVEAPAHDGDPLQLGFRLYRPEDDVRAVQESVYEQLTAATGRPVYRCRG